MNGFVSHIDARAKLIWAILGATLVFQIDTCAGQALFFALFGLVLLCIGTDFRRLIKSIRYFLIFLPLTFAVHLVFTGGILGLLTGKPGGNVDLQMPLMFTIRIGNFLFLMAFVFQWIGAVETLDCIHWSIRPLKRFGIRTDDLFQVVFIAVQFFPIVKEEYRRLDQGWRSFVSSDTSSVRKRILHVRERLIPLMIFSFRKAETLAEAMAVRGYAGRSERSYYGQFESKPIDVALACGSAVVLLILVAGLPV
ncbi:MAG: energy-coupling factor transporter transmembrane component T [Candidatus Neomarinimicrobiota bacterium]